MKSTFKGISKEDVTQLRLEDAAIDEIRGRAEAGLEISFSWFRSRFGRNTGNWASIDRGRAILGSTDQLSQYLYTHGLMIESQWENLLPSYAHHGGPLRIVDYGCGQGLAGLLLAKLGAKSPLSVARQIMLIEPSPVALVRAEAVYRSLAPESEISCICKCFDDVSEEDLAHRELVPSLHVFSNVLDIKGYDRFGLLSKALTAGEHTILAVSHDRDHDGGSERIRSLDRALRAPAMADQLTVGRSDIRKFKCSNPSQSDAIYWHCQMEVNNE